MRSPRQQPASPAKGRLRLPWRDLLDILALGTWSAMLFRYWASDLLLLLLHPNYAWLSNSAAIVLALLALYKLGEVIQSLRASWAQSARAKANSSSDNGGHVALLPRNLSSAVLLSIAVFGLIYTPRAFASQTAVQRGIADTLTLTRTQPQRFARASAPEERTIIDWIRLVNVYPEPDAYTDEAVEVEGFVIYPESWPEGYLMVSRFVLTCCAADAYPVGLPVKLSPESLQENSAEDGKPYPVDTWLSVKGRVATDTLDGLRQIAIAPTDIQIIEEPKNPYEY
ncbi:MAG: TIGR03943 family protein [Cyanobacteria bacterium P01_D01_bin.36]